MKTAKELYPQEDHWFSVYSYQPILNEIGNIIIQVDDKDYQGDTRVVFEKDGKYGFLIFGWGSCSGCDALQACNNHESVQELMDGMVNDVEWFDSFDLLKKRFAERDWELQYSWHHEGTRDFIKQVLLYK